MDNRQYKNVGYQLEQKEMPNFGISFKLT